MYFILSITIILVLVAVVVKHPYIRENSRITKDIVSVAIGVMFSVLSLHLLPEVYGGESDIAPYVFLITLVFFYVLGWTTHNHEHDEDTHGHNHVTKIVPMFLGQSVHAIADGITITASWIASPLVGIVTSIAIATHHIPMMSGIAEKNREEMKDSHITIATIVSSGCMYIGALLAYFLSSYIVPSIFIAVAAASFAYIGGYDLTTYIKETNDKAITRRVLFLILGVSLGALTELLEHIHFSF